MTKEIPDDIRNWIEDEAEKYVRKTYPFYKGDDLHGGTYDSFFDGAIALYTFLSEKIEQKDKEIERLKGLIEKAHTRGWLDYPDQDQYDIMSTKNNTIESSWEKFKISNNL